MSIVIGSVKEIQVQIFLTINCSLESLNQRTIQFKRPAKSLSSKIVKSS
jgi:hypothetical protein